MKILTLSNLYPPNICGGYERLCFSVMEGLTQRHCEISVLTSSFGGQQTDYPGQRVLRSLRLLATEGNIYQPFAATPREIANYNAGNIETLRDTVESIQPDIIFVWNLYFFDRSLIDFLEKEYGSRVVYFLTDNWLITFFNMDYWSHYMRRVVGAGESEDAVATNNPQITFTGRAIFGSQHMGDFYRRGGLTFADSTVIHNGVPLERIEQSRFRNRLLPLNHNRLELLFAGRVVEFKGVHTLVETLPALRKALPAGRQLHLSIVGDCQDQAYHERLLSFIAEHDLHDVVTFRDPVAPELLFDLFQSADIYVFPSLYEPFALTLIHALHAGLPTVASRVGGNVEIVQNGKTGMLFRKNDSQDLARAVLDLVRQPMLRQSVALNAQGAAWEFTFARMISRIEAYLRRHE